ncbi:MAG TPA: toxin-antitoxin system HicB family antitoxin, partial [bacterium]|nr:toxin-antitoxin system HicB family antitoxin [bacterium]
DQCYVGTCPELMIGGVHGKNETRVYNELCKVVDDWIKIYQKDNEPLPEPVIHKDYSGKFILRIGKELHKVLAIKALLEGVSLNHFCMKLIKSKLA